jgi:hypothetical protein
MFVSMTFFLFAETDVQADALVLQLAGHCAGSGSVPVRAQGMWISSKQSTRQREGYHAHAHTHARTQEIGLFQN